MRFIYAYDIVYGKLLEHDLGIHTTDLRDIDTGHVEAMPRACIACGAGVGGSSTAITGALCPGRSGGSVLQLLLQDLGMRVRK